MKKKEKKSQGDILAVANETMRQLNEMIDNPEQYRLKKINLKKARDKKNKDREER